MASTNPVGVKSRKPDRLPSWKIQTSAPNEAPSDSTFITTALTGSTIEPKARNSSTNVVATTNRPIHGSSEPRLSSRSSSTAAWPPTSASPPSGAGTARTSPTSARASSPIGSPP